MSSFKKKSGIKLNACYYGGDLDGFAPDYATTLTLTDTELVIESKKAKATLDRERLLTCEVFTDEQQYTAHQYTAKYCGHAAGLGKAMPVERGFIVFTFKANDGVTKRMDFWFYVLNCFSATSMWKTVNGAEKKEYSL